MVLEVNALAPFSVSILPIKTGKRVTHVKIGWWSKNKDEVDAAWREVNRARIGRKVRIAGQTVHVAEPFLVRAA